MKTITQSQLFKINREFYEKQGESFDSTRDKPWDGWQKLLLTIKTLNPKNILDIGCGNGRFAKFLSDYMNLKDFNYFGFDNSTQLLKAAKQLGLQKNKYKFKYLDLQQTPLSLEANAKYDLIVIFGVMHHLPGYENRLNLLKLANSLLNQNGLLIVSYWQFGAQKRFQDKFVSWDKLPKIDQTNLEKNDFLLGWQDSHSLRYCHYTNEEEIKKLTNDAKLQKVREFFEDGREHNLNIYVVYTHL